MGKYIYKIIGGILMIVDYICCHKFLFNLSMFLIVFCINMSIYIKNLLLSIIIFIIAMLIFSLIFGYKIYTVGYEQGQKDLCNEMLNHIQLSYYRDEERNDENNEEEH